MSSRKPARLASMTFPELKEKDVDGFLFASSYCGRNPFQVNAAPVMAERIGIKPP